MHYVAHIKRFLGYAASGSLTTLAELVFLNALLSATHLPYYFAVPIAFATFTTIHYLVCRYVIFGPSPRPVVVEYAYFVTILFSGMLLTTTIVTLFVEFVYPNPLIGRVLAGVFVVFWDYNMNVRFNFRLKRR